MDICSTYMGLLAEYDFFHSDQRHGPLGTHGFLVDGEIHVCGEGVLLPYFEDFQSGGDDGQREQILCCDPLQSAFCAGG